MLIITIFIKLTSNIFQYTVREKNYLQLSKFLVALQYVPQIYFVLLVCSGKRRDCSQSN